MPQQLLIEAMSEGSMWLPKWAVTSHTVGLMEIGQFICSFRTLASSTLLQGQHPAGCRSRRVLYLLLVPHCHVFSEDTHMHNHCAVLLVTIHREITSLLTADIEIAKSKQRFQKQEEQEVTAVTAKMSMFPFL